MSIPELDLVPDLDTCFVGEHDGPPVAHHVARGRRHVRRRRVSAALAVAGVVAVVGTGFAVADRSPEASGIPATSSSAPPTPDPTVRTEYDWPESNEDLLRINGYLVTAEGELLLRDGVELLERVDLPAPAGGKRSYGLDLVLDGEETWVHTTALGTGTSVAPVAGTTFRDWLEGVAAKQRPPTPEQEAAVARQREAWGALEVDRRGRVTLAPGAEVLERVENPMRLTAPYQSAALRVRYRGDESWWWVTPGGGSPYPVESLGDTTFERWQQQRLAVGPTFSSSGPMPPLVKIVDGMPRLLDGVEVLRRVGNPLGVSAPARSVAYWARLEDGSEWWYLWELGPSGYAAAEVNRAAGDGYPDFDTWLADQRSQAPW